MYEAFIVYKRNYYIDNSTYFEINIPNNIEHYVYDNEKLSNTSFEKAGIVYLNILSNDYRDAISKLNVLSNISGKNCNLIVINVKCKNEFKIDDIKEGLKKLNINYFFRFNTPVVYYNLVSVTNFLATNINIISKKTKKSKVIWIIILLILLIIFIYFMCCKF